MKTKSFHTERKDLLEKILLAEDHAVPGETLVGELTPTLGTLETARVPRPLQHLEDEAVEDQLVAASALRDTRCKTKTKLLQTNY